MTTIVFRSGATGASGVKNAPLTAAEIDSNFANLNSYKVEQSVEGAHIPAATGATGAQGYLRYNPATSQFEGYGATGWGSIGTTTQGASGVSGATGITGATGSDGVQGASGSTGLSGATGVGGASGTIGVNGASGATGAQGSTGPQGASGIAGTGLTAGASGTGYVNYNGLTAASGQFYGGATGPSNTTRLNYDGNLHANAFYGDGSNLTGIATTISITDDNSTNTTEYLMTTRGASGTLSGTYISSTKLYFNPSTGTLSATTFNSLSDSSYKTNINTIDNALEIVSQIDGVSFDWKETGFKSYGVIAQEVEKIIPELIDGDEIKTVNYSGLIAFLINAVKELNNKVKELESR